jgi:hypothetical protein
MQLLKQGGERDLRIPFSMFSSSSSFILASSTNLDQHPSTPSLLSFQTLNFGLVHPTLYPAVHIKVKVKLEVKYA